MSQDSIAKALVPREFSRRWSDFWGVQADRLHKAGYTVITGDGWASVAKDGEIVAAFERSMVRGTIEDRIDALTGESAPMPRYFTTSYSRLRYGTD